MPQEHEFYGFAEEELGLKEFKSVISPNRLKLRDDFYLPLCLSHRQRKKCHTYEKTDSTDKDIDSNLLGRKSNSHTESLDRKKTLVPSPKHPGTAVKSPLSEVANPYAKQYRSYRRGRSGSPSSLIFAKEVEQNTEKIVSSAGSNRFHKSNGLIEPSCTVKDKSCHSPDGQARPDNVITDPLSEYQKHNDLKLTIQYQTHTRPKRSIAVPEQNDFVYGIASPGRKRQKDSCNPVITDAKILKVDGNHTNQSQQEQLISEIKISEPEPFKSKRKKRFKNFRCGNESYPRATIGNLPLSFENVANTLEKVCQDNDNFFEDESKTNEKNAFRKYEGESSTSSNLSTGGNEELEKRFIDKEKCKGAVLEMEGIGKDLEPQSDGDEFTLTNQNNDVRSDISTCKSITVGDKESIDSITNTRLETENAVYHSNCQKASRLSENRVTRNSAGSKVNSGCENVLSKKSGLPKAKSINLTDTWFFASVPASKRSHRFRGACNTNVESAKPASSLQAENILSSSQKNQTDKSMTPSANQGSSLARRRRLKNVTYSEMAGNVPVDICSSDKCSSIDKSVAENRSGHQVSMEVESTKLPVLDMGCYSKMLDKLKRPRDAEENTFEQRAQDAKTQNKVIDSYSMINKSDSLKGANQTHCSINFETPAASSTCASKEEVSGNNMVVAIDTNQLLSGKCKEENTNFYDKRTLESGIAEFSNLQSSLSGPEGSGHQSLDELSPIGTNLKSSKNAKQPKKMPDISRITEQREEIEKNAKQKRCNSFTSTTVETVSKKEPTINSFDQVSRKRRSLSSSDSNYRFPLQEQKKARTQMMFAKPIDTIVSNQLITQKAHRVTEPRTSGITNSLLSTDNKIRESHAKVIETDKKEKDSDPGKYLSANCDKNIANSEMSCIVNAGANDSAEQVFSLLDSNYESSKATIVPSNSKNESLLAVTDTALQISNIKYNSGHSVMPNESGNSDDSIHPALSGKPEDRYRIKRKIYTMVRKIRRTEINADGKRVTKIIKQIVKKVCPVVCDEEYAHTDKSGKSGEIAKPIHTADLKNPWQEKEASTEDRSKASLVVQKAQAAVQGRCNVCSGCLRKKDCNICENCR